MRYRTKVRTLDAMPFDRGNTEALMLFLGEHGATDVRIERGYLSFLWSGSRVTAPLGYMVGFGDDGSVSVLCRDALESGYEPVGIEQGEP